MTQAEEPSQGPEPSTDEPQLRPLLVRPGARYQCFADGLCCTDIHGLGPLSETELVQIRRLDPLGVDTDGDFDEPMLRTRPDDGGCIFLRPDRLCSIHAKHGGQAKPGFCQRFPLGLVATPRGGRVTTEHRCPCRTMGARPEVTAEGAEPSLFGEHGDLHADRHVEHVNLDRDRRVSFAEWERIEAAMFERLWEGGKPSKVLGAGPFPPLRRSTWKLEAEEMLEADQDSTFEAILLWFADAILARHARHRPPKRDRPWAWAFDRAEQREGDTPDADYVLIDWLVDDIWSLGWVGEHPFKKAAADMVTRYLIARDLSGRLRRQGVGSGRAAAEAVMIVDTVSASEWWTDIVAKMRA
jgi:hypothetical protein